VLLAHLIGDGSNVKHVPAEIFELAADQIAFFLGHLWAADGTIHVRKANSKGSSVVRFSTNSRQLADDVAALLLRLGILTRIHEVRQGENRPMYSVGISGAEQQLRFLDRVAAFGAKCRQADALRSRLSGTVQNTHVDTIPREVFEGVQSLVAEPGISQRAMAAMRGTGQGGTSHFRFSPSRNVVASYAELLDDEPLRQAATSDLFWDRIVAIEACGREEVFDLTVPGPASWLADGIVSHNSGAIEQDADTIIFIYRDEYYNREASTEKGIAELIIAKQRNGPTGIIKTRFVANITKFENLAPGELDDFEDFG
jgi:replicative DNA helicase